MNILCFAVYLLSMCGSSTPLLSLGNIMGETIPLFVSWTSSLQSPALFFSIGLDVFTGPSPLNGQSNPVKKKRKGADLYNITHLQTKI